MFTGLIETVGRIAGIGSDGVARVFRVEAPALFDDLKVDDSVSVDGVCLTVTGLDSPIFEVTAVPETLRKTTLGGLQANHRVNLERAVRLSDRLGGHLVQGHVDGTARVSQIQREGADVLLSIDLPEAFARYLIPHGSIALQGVSLTIARLDGPRVTIALIPHTLSVTTLGDVRVGDPLNFEVDLLAKYVERLLRQGEDGITEGLLRQHGFA